jgi:hypothetical protein
MGLNVNWVAFVPVESRLKDMVSGGAKLSKMEHLASEIGINLHTIAFPITISRIHSYLFRQWLVRRAGKHLAKMLMKLEKNTEPHIVHCRSYFATAVALEAKKQLENILISFDMRSLLPPEIPLMFPFIGKFIYGNLKNWESDLLKLSNYSFLPCHRGIALLELEGVSRLPTYIPIAGFDEKQYTHNLSNTLANQIIGYVGSFGPWYSVRLLEKVFDEIAANLPTCSFEVLTNNATDFKRTVLVRTVPHHEVKIIITKMLAVVVQGPEYFVEHFSEVKLSTNFFSTKAAEALSV